MSFYGAVGWLGLLAIGFIALMFGLGFLGSGTQWVADRGGGAAATIGLAAFPVIIGATYYWQEKRQSRYTWEDKSDWLKPCVYAAAPLAVLAIFMGMGWRSANMTVSDYCAYGSVSQAQLDGCRDHVTAQEVNDRDTPAARFARGAPECGEDSGPFCEGVLTGRQE